MSRIYLLIIFLCIGCHTTENRVNTLVLPGWGSITFEDTLVDKDGEKCRAKYYNRNGLHDVHIARDSPNIERSILHEGLHSEDMHHDTEDEEKVFYETMRTRYGF